MCEAFAMSNCKIDVIVPKRKNNIKENAFEFFHIKEIFNIKYLWCFDGVMWGKFGYWLASITFIISVIKYSFWKNDIFYTRDESIAFFLKLIGKKVAWEAHRGQNNFFVRSLIFFGVPTVVITGGLRNLYLELGFKEDLILVAPDAVDIEQFDLPINRNEAKEKLKLNVNKKIILYSGHLYSWKGADILAKAAMHLGGDVEVVFVGGTDVDVETFFKKYGHVENITILGKKPHHLIPFYLRAADVLILPNSKGEDISRLYTSPMKLFEYMASNTPIISSDLPSLREILNEDTAYFFKSDDVIDLVDVIKYVLSNESDSKEKAKRARISVEEYSWHKRAKNIINFLGINK